MRALALLALGALVGFAAVDLAGRGAPEDRALAALDAEAMREAVTDALRDPDTYRRALTLHRLAVAMNPGNVEGAAAALDALVVPALDCDVETLVYARAAFDPKGAFEQALRWKAPHKRELALQAAAYLWALRGGVPEAREFADTIALRGSREAAQTGVIRGWARSDDVDGATRFLTQMPDDPNGVRNDLLITFVTGPLLYDRGPDALIAWASAIPEDAPNGFKAAVYRNTLTQLASGAPEQAVEWYEGHRDKPYHQGSLWLLAVGWQEVDPEAALAWLLSQPEESAREGAIVRAMGRWLNRDRPAAMRWIAQADLDPELRDKLSRIWSPGAGRRPRGGA